MIVNSFCIVRETALRVMNECGHDMKAAMQELFNREQEALSDKDVSMAMFWARVEQFVSMPCSKSQH